MFINNDFNFDEFQNMSNINDNKEMNGQNIDLNGCDCPKVCECPQERCCTRQIHHCVEHIVPVNTKIINHHIYHHVYKPVYTCTEENICSNDCCPM